MFWYEIFIVIAVLARDLGSKYGIVKALGIEHVAGGKFVQHNDDIEFIRNFISFYLIFNKKENKVFRTLLVLILAGGLGNLYDRIVFGYVRDFIVFDFWPNFATFNVADSFLTVATILFAIYAIFFMPKDLKKRQEEKEKQDSTYPPAYPYDAINRQDIIPDEPSDDAAALKDDGNV